MRIRHFFLIATATLAVATTSCKEDPVPVTSATDLVSLKVTTAPALDGTIDASWDACNKLTNKTAMPAADVFEGIYAFFQGDTHNFTIRSMYDDSNIYFLVEIDDDTKSMDMRSWYFDATAQKWVYPKNAISATDKFGEDKFGLIFPVKSNANWDKYTCYSTCHTDNPAVKDHYADDNTFMGDVWQWRSVSTEPYGQLQDGYLGVGTVTNGVVTAPGRKRDSSPNNTSTNTQKLIPTGGTVAIDVPKYILISDNGEPLIRQEDVTSGKAKLVTAVSTTGVLTYDGGTLDPNAAPSDYAYKTGSKRIKSIFATGPIAGSQGDVMTAANYVDGKGWVVEVKRAISTTDIEHDCQFDTTKEYKFGFSVFNNAGSEHSVKPDLKLKFAIAAITE